MTGELNRQKGTQSKAALDAMVVEPRFFDGPPPKAEEPRSRNEVDQANRSLENHARKQQSLLRRVLKYRMARRAWRFAKNYAMRASSKTVGQGLGKRYLARGGAIGSVAFAARIAVRNLTQRSFENLEYVRNPWNHMHRARAMKRTREEFENNPVIQRIVAARQAKGEVAGDVMELYDRIVDMETIGEQGKFQLTQDPRFQYNTLEDLFALEVWKTMKAAWEATPTQTLVDQALRALRLARFGT